MNILNEMTEILIANLKRRKRPQVDLTNADSPYVKFFFDYLSDESIDDVLKLFPEGDRLCEKYNRMTASDQVSDKELCTIVDAYLQSSKKLMDRTDQSEAINFLDSYESVQVGETVPEFSFENHNQLHLHAYGAIGDWLIRNMPMDPEYQVIFEWSIERTSYYSVPAYLLEDYLDIEKGTFEPAFQLWNSGNSKNYWAEGNSFESKAVYCKALGWPN